MSLIVVGTDGSKGSRAAIAEGVDLARRLEAAVVFSSGNVLRVAFKQTSK